MFFGTTADVRSCEGLRTPAPVCAEPPSWGPASANPHNNGNLHVLPDLLERWVASSPLPPVTTFAFNARAADRTRSF
jgi:hypothetical protein